MNAMRRLVDASEGLPVTVHRAFDQTSDWRSAFEQLNALGVDRILSSGCAHRAEDGLDVAAALIQAAGDELIVVAGGGVSSANVESICAATGASEVHSSARARSQARLTCHDVRHADDPGCS